MVPFTTWAISRLQRNGQPFREFTRRAMAGGVQGYIAFLRGKRVMYWGRNGEQHVEWFPGAKAMNKLEKSQRLAKQIAMRPGAFKADV